MRKLAVLILLLFAATPLLAQKRPRARDLGIPFDGVPGARNALTDVPGVELIRRDVKELERLGLMPRSTEGDPGRR